MSEAVHFSVIWIVLSRSLISLQLPVYKLGAEASNFDLKKLPHLLHFLVKIQHKRMTRSKESHTFLVEFGKRLERRKQLSKLLNTPNSLP